MSNLVLFGGGLGLGRRSALLSGRTVALPLVLYLSIPPGEGWELTPGAVGLSWSVGGVALFSALGWRQVDPRLSLAGYGAVAPLLGRVASLTTLGLLLGAAMLPPLLVRSDPKAGAALALAMLLTVVLAVPLGLAIGAPCSPGSWRGCWP